MFKSKLLLSTVALLNVAGFRAGNILPDIQFDNRINPDAVAVAPKLEEEEPADTSVNEVADENITNFMAMQTKVTLYAGDASELGDKYQYQIIFKFDDSYNLSDDDGIDYGVFVTLDTELTLSNTTGYTSLTDLTSKWCSSTKKSGKNYGINLKGSQYDLLISGFAYIHKNGRYYFAKKATSSVKKLIEQYTNKDSEYNKSITNEERQNNEEKIKDIADNVKKADETKEGFPGALEALDKKSLDDLSDVEKLKYVAKLSYATSLYNEDLVANDDKATYLARMEAYSKYAEPIYNVSTGELPVNDKHLASVSVVDDAEVGKTIDVKLNDIATEKTDYSIRFENDMAVDSSKYSSIAVLVKQHINRWGKEEDKSTELQFWNSGRNAFASGMKYLHGYGLTEEEKGEYAVLSYEINSDTVLHNFEINIRNMIQSIPQGEDTDFYVAGIFGIKKTSTIE